MGELAEQPEEFFTAEFEIPAHIILTRLTWSTENDANTVSSTSSYN
jgi:hypothetical protein